MTTKQWWEPYGQTKWYEWWNPLSGFFGGCIAGCIFGVIVCSPFVMVLR